MTKGATKRDSCPRCGAPKCHQKFTPRHPREFGRYELISSLNPVDCVQCSRCGTAFSVNVYEHDGALVIDLGDASFECVPRYCPICGEKVAE